MKAWGSKFWMRFPADCLDKAVYGRVVDVYKHIKHNAMLIHTKNVGTGHKQEKTSGVWWVILNGEVIFRKFYYSEVMSARNAPTSWACKILDRHKQGTLICDDFSLELYA